MGQVHSTVQRPWSQPASGIWRQQCGKSSCACPKCLKSFQLVRVPSPVTNEHWRYFLAIEEDVERTTRFVEPSPANYRAFSIEFARLILSTCSEVDVVAKVLCEQLAPASPASNMDQYRRTIRKAFPKVHRVVVRVPRFDLVMEPWKEWGSNKNPGWWKDHQLVKHHRHKSFALADLEHCIVAAAGLFSLTLYLCRGERISLENTRLFDVGIHEGVGGWRKFQLPDDPL